MPGGLQPAPRPPFTSQEVYVWPKRKQEFKFLPCLHPSAKLPWRNLMRCTTGRYRAAGGSVSLAALQRHWIPLGRKSTEIPLC